MVNVTVPQLGATKPKQYWNNSEIITVHVHYVINETVLIKVTTDY